MSRCAVTWPAQAPSTWPPTTAASWTVQTRPGGRNVDRRVERGPDQVGARLERVRDRDDDPLAVDQQVGQVVGDEVADGDRRQARRRSRPSSPARPTTRATPAMIHRNTIRITVFWTSAGLPNTVAKATVCDSPSKMIDAVPRATSATRGISHVASSRPLANGRRTTAAASTRVRVLVVGVDAARLGGPRRRHDAVDRQPVQRPEPDRERLALRRATGRARTAP